MLVHVFFEVFVVVAHEHVIDFVNGGPDIGDFVLVAHEQVIDVVNVGPDVDIIDVFALVAIISTRSWNLRLKTR